MNAPRVISPSPRTYPRDVHHPLPGTPFEHGLGRFRPQRTEQACGRRH